MCGNATTIRNRITQNAIYANTITGIDTSQGGNGEITPPVIIQVNGNTVRGVAALAQARVEIFSDQNGQGRVFEGAVTAMADGTFTFTKSGGFSGPNLTVTATDSDGNTSEFSIPVAIITRTPNRDAHPNVACANRDPTEHRPRQPRRPPASPRPGPDRNADSHTHTLPNPHSNPGFGQPTRWLRARQYMRRSQRDCCQRQRSRAQFSRGRGCRLAALQRHGEHPLCDFCHPSGRSG
ncbi:MAG: hypothetical protein IPO15_22065 [Anaerolineae bacterium]|uniref:hypothetical protein n=1 Tax=Candidatus Amarolinea dominans TaxID=3140696 RepID=UPI0031365C75|nr:hypothetical protein [Anaerolineae bacterium]